MKKRTTLLSMLFSLIVGVTAVTGTANAINAQTASATSVVSKTAFEYVDETLKYFEDPQGQIWQFSNIYAVEEDFEPTISNLRMLYSKGVVCSKYTGSEEPFYVQDYESMFTWDTEGTYEFNGETYEYNLVSPDRLTLNDRQVLEQLIVHIIPTDPTRLTYYDYSKDGSLKIDDLIQMNKRFAATPMNFVTNLDGVLYDEMSADDFFGILYYYDNLGETEICIRYGDTVPQSSTTTTTTTTTTTSTTTTTTTSTTKPTTTTTTTTSTTKPTTTTTTTTSTTKPTTTTTTTTSTTKPTTTTTTTTSTTKPTTTTTTTTSTTKPTTTTTTTTLTTKQTTTTTNNWTPPAMEELVHEGETIDEETYNILINTAEMFNIDQYRIVWSDEPIDYAYTNPGSYYCMETGMAYGYGVQIAPGKDIDNLETGLGNWEAGWYRVIKHMCFRPIVSEDSNEEVIASYEVNLENEEYAYKTENGLFAGRIDNIIYPEDLNDESEYPEKFQKLNNGNYFNISGWYLIPINESGEDVLELAYPNEYNIEVEDAGYVHTWFTHEEINPMGVKQVLRTDFYDFQTTAEQLGFASYKICFNKSETEPVYYSFLPREANISHVAGLYKGCMQATYAEDISILYPGLWEKVLEKWAGDETAAEYEYNTTYLTRVCYLWADIQNVSEKIDSATYLEDIVLFYTYDGQDLYNCHYMVPLDENGEEILKLYYTE